MAGKLALVGIFEYLNEVVSALETLKKEKVRIDTVYSPMQRHEIREALGLPALTVVRFFTLTGAILGIATGIFLTWYTTAQWHFIVGGKPPIPIYPTVIPAFEFFILISVFFNLAGMLIMNRLPKTRFPAHYDKRFTQDRFGVLVYCTGPDREKVAEIMRNSGAEEVHQVEE